MAKGNELATFAMTSTSATFRPGPAGAVITAVNWEGTATGGFGAVLGTAEFVGGNSGTLSYCGASYLDDGGQLYLNGSGDYESTGQHRWKTTLILDFSDGSRILGEGEIDLAARTWNGKVYSWV